MIEGSLHLFEASGLSGDAAEQAIEEALSPVTDALELYVPLEGPAELHPRMCDLTLCEVPPAADQKPPRQCRKTLTVWFSFAFRTALLVRPNGLPTVVSYPPTAALALTDARNIFSSL